MAISYKAVPQSARRSALRGDLGDALGDQSNVLILRSWRSSKGRDARGEQGRIALGIVLWPPGSSSRHRLALLHQRYDEMRWRRWEKGPAPAATSSCSPSRVISATAAGTDKKVPLCWACSPSRSVRLLPARATLSRAACSADIRPLVADSSTAIRSAVSGERSTHEIGAR
jgi:hypothetical protein